jgi:NADH-dependent peroxiredoxin subunit F
MYPTPTGCVPSRTESDAVQRTLVRGAVDLTDRKEIVVDQRGATSVPGVFAAGDCTTVPYKQIVTAMGTESVAALSAFDHLIRTSAPAEGS